MIEILSVLAQGIGDCCGPSTGSLLVAYAEIVAGLALAGLLAWGAVLIFRKLREQP